MSKVCQVTGKRARVGNNVSKANNKTIEGRKMNRRIELILSPNLDDLYQILEE